MLTLEEQQQISRIRKKLTKLQLQVVAFEGRFHPSDLRMALDQLCRAAETLTIMHLEDRQLSHSIQFVEEKLTIARNVLMGQQLTKK
ncbi:hypothetical protein [Melghirimyces algeriensis]|uniref:Uncharacterized protein n=1 Tax=Melghirimyces algeriensis TaxID=910412 RepID=A0A521BKU1_9BACL|nr:hypothetical protein [Melghirimyces algeriensis]SMO47441.1 hypothetical protein SAMN06264849_102148 [Melghirimyces algeriensis]